MLLLFACQGGWKIPFHFVKHVVKVYAEGGSAQIKVISVMSQSFAQLPQKLSRKRINKLIAVI